MVWWWGACERRAGRTDAWVHELCMGGSCCRRGRSGAARVLGLVAVRVVLAARVAGVGSGEGGDHVQDARQQVEEVARGATFAVQHPKERVHCKHRRGGVAHGGHRVLAAVWIRAATAAQFGLLCSSVKGQWSRKCTRISSGPSQVGSVWQVGVSMCSLGRRTRIECYMFM